MKDSFFDTSVLIYCYTYTELEKRRKARGLVKESVCISLQIIQEFTNVLKKKFGKNSDEILPAIKELKQSFRVHQNSVETVIRATGISEKYQYSFYDSLVLAAALEANCSILYSEDLHNRQVIDKKLTIINPFA